MSKRFTDTKKWDKPWFRRLSPGSKCFVLYLFDNCNNAGIWEYDIEAAEFYIGEEIKNPLTIFPDDFKIIEFDNKWFLPNFLKFQYEKSLNSSKPAIVSVRNQLIKYDLTKIVNTLYGNDYLMINESLPNDSRIIKDKDKDKDRDKDKDKDKDKDEEKEKEKESTKEREREKTFAKAEKIVTWALKEGKKANINFKDVKAHRKNYIDTIAKLIDIDKKTPSGIVSVLNWAIKSWWMTSGNFLTLNKLRQKNKENVTYYDVFEAALAADAVPKRQAVQAVRNNHEIAYIPEYYKLYKGVTDEDNIET